MTEPYNVNTARNERRATKPAAWAFTLDGDTYNLPIELSRPVAKSLRQLDDHDVDGLLRLLLGDEQYARFEQCEVTMQDIAALLEAYGSQTGLGLKDI